MLHQRLLVLVFLVSLLLREWVVVKAVTNDKATPFSGERARDERVVPKMSIIL